MTSIHVERRAKAYKSFTKKVERNGGGSHFYSIKDSQFVVEKGIIIKNLKIATK